MLLTFCFTKFIWPFPVLWIWAPVPRSVPKKLGLMGLPFLSTRGGGIVATIWLWLSVMTSAMGDWGCQGVEVMVRLCEKTTSSKWLKNILTDACDVYSHASARWYLDVLCRRLERIKSQARCWRRDFDCQECWRGRENLMWKVMLVHYIRRKSVWGDPYLYGLIQLPSASKYK